MVSLKHYDEIHRSLSIGGTVMIVSPQLMSFKNHTAYLVAFTGEYIH